jgi:hypothetical protein
MNVSRAISALAVFATATVAIGAASAAAPGHASIVIRHQTAGCHTWSVDGGAFKARQVVALKRGAWIVVTNNDIMPHTLIKTSGPALRMVNLKTPNIVGLRGHFGPGAMAHIGAKVRVTFSAPGVYHLTTKPGEDYMKAPATMGEDNVLRLTVKVS